MSVSGIVGFNKRLREMTSTPEKAAKFASPLEQAAKRMALSTGAYRLHPSNIKPKVQ